jgi:23S rRNA (guanosine2251-2'-O)-methyltransferase
MKPPSSGNRPPGGGFSGNRTGGPKPPGGKTYPGKPARFGQGEGRSGGARGETRGGDTYGDPKRGGAKHDGPRHGTGAYGAKGPAQPPRNAAARSQPSSPAPARAHTQDPRQPRLSAPAAASPEPYTPPPGTRPGPRAGQSGKPQAPAGTIWLYGMHPVAAALANPQRRLRRLLVTEEAEATLADLLKGAFSVAPERTERARLDHLLGHDAVHQGVALLADPLPQPALAAVLERSGPLLVLDQVTDPRNVGAILRSAAAFGVAAVIAQDRHAPEETGALAKAASGALEIMPLIRAVNLSRTLVALKAAGLWTVGLAADAAPLRGEALRERRVALVLGAEGAGMRRLTRETCEELAGLAMPGGMESLNVSAAASVALYELTRR